MKNGSSDGKILERWHQPSESLENNEIYLLWYACATSLYYGPYISCFLNIPFQAAQVKSKERGTTDSPQHPLRKAKVLVHLIDSFKISQLESQIHYKHKLLLN